MEGSDHDAHAAARRAVYATLGLAILVLVVTYGGMDDLAARRGVPADAGAGPALARSEPVGRRAAKAAEMLAEFGPEAAPFLLAAAHDADGLVREQAV